MIPLDKLFMIDAGELIMTPLLYKVFKRGFSKIPIFSGDRHNIQGIIAAKSMITASEYQGRPIAESIKMSKPAFVCKDHNLLELMSIF